MSSQGSRRPGKRTGRATSAVTRKSRGLSSLTNDDRLKICKMYLDRRQKNEISKIFKIHKSTVTRIVQRFIETDSHESMPKGGRTSHTKLQEDQLKVVEEFLQSKVRNSVSRKFLLTARIFKF